MSQLSNRPVVQVPAPADDHPLWARVGVIALIGFAIGIAWPRLAGVKLGPTPPEERGLAAAVSAQAPSSAAAAVSAAGVPEAPSGSGSPDVGAADLVAVSAGKVLSCRDAKGKPQEDCDTPDFDGLAVPHLRALATRCAVSKGLNGKASVGFELDFNHGRLRVVHGKSSGLAANAVMAVWQCVETEFQKARLDEITHQHARYRMFYTVQFVPPGKQPDIEQASEKPESAPDQDKGSQASSGSAQVVYDTVLVRDEPKEGKVIGRLVRGARVELLSRKGGWYKIRFGDREGWVYRGSIAQ